MIGLRKAFAEKPVVADLCLSLRQGELLSLLGPSGCGKTTTLKLIGGFLAADSGEILLDGAPIHQLPPESRPVCTVFQSYALFPHMTALENVMYGLRCHGKNRMAAKKEALAMLALVDLVNLADLAVTRLSGGQQQRVALARVLALQPKVLLLDEPFSNLDARLRLQMRDEVRSLQRRLDLTTLFVTHDREEALGLSDRIAVMENGGIAQIATPRQTYDSPVNRYVAECVGHVNHLQSGGRTFFFRPEHGLLHRGDADFYGEILSVSFLGHFSRYLVQCLDSIITIDLVTENTEELQAGDRVGLSITRYLFV